MENSSFGYMNSNELKHFILSEKIKSSQIYYISNNNNLKNIMSDDILEILLKYKSVKNSLNTLSYKLNSDKQRSMLLDKVLELKENYTFKNIIQNWNISDPSQLDKITNRLLSRGGLDYFKEGVFDRCQFSEEQKILLLNKYGYNISGEMAKKVEKTIKNKSELTKFYNSNDHFKRQQIRKLNIKNKKQRLLAIKNIIANPNYIYDMPAKFNISIDDLRGLKPLQRLDILNVIYYNAFCASEDHETLDPYFKFPNTKVNLNSITEDELKEVLFPLSMEYNEALSQFFNNYRRYKKWAAMIKRKVSLL